MHQFLVVLVSFLVVFVASGPCKMSPLTTFLTDDQQKTLHQLIVSARESGANEEMVKESMDEYLAEILSPSRLVEFRNAHDRFEMERREKRETKYEKPEPKKVFDIIEEFTKTSDYRKFYEESTASRNRNKSH